MRELLMVVKELTVYSEYTCIVACSDVIVLGRFTFSLPVALATAQLLS
jgi:hypothetical protein